MAATRVAGLEVPGARLHYEVRGAGPVLLVVPGMPADDARRVLDAVGAGPAHVLSDLYRQRS